MEEWNELGAAKNTITGDHGLEKNARKGGREGGREGGRTDMAEDGVWGLGSMRTRLV
jgi:hypothetical protein